MTIGSDKAEAWHMSKQDQAPHQSTGLVQVVVHTIGTLHPDALDLVTAHDGLVHNLGGTRFRNPHEDPALRELTGLDAPVREHVLSTPGLMREIDTIVDRTRAALSCWARSHRLVHVTLACQGGRHRSVAAGEALASRLRARAVGVEVEHHHIGRPVVQR